MTAFIISYPSKWRKNTARQPKEIYCSITGYSEIDLYRIISCFGEYFNKCSQRLLFAYYFAIF